MIGLCYADEAGASQLYKKVQNRAKYGMSYMLMDSQVELQLIGLWLCQKTHEFYGIVFVQQRQGARCKNIGYSRYPDQRATMEWTSRTARKHGCLGK